MEDKLEKFGQNSFMDNFVKTDDILNDMCGIIESSQKAAYQAVNIALVQRNWLLGFLDNHENILFVGSSGVGKTHLATSIGISCAKARNITYFITFENLMNQLKAAHHENRLESRLKFFAKYKVLIIDEIGYIPIDLDSANLFFQLIARRYEKNSTIITINTPFSRLGEIFGSATLANAVLDRLLHYSSVISIKGPSYRLKDKRAYLETQEAEA